MAFRLGLAPHSLRTAESNSSACPKRLFHFLPSTPIKPSSPLRFHPNPSAQTIARTRSNPPLSNSRLYITLGLGTALAYLTLTPFKSIQCETISSTHPAYPQGLAGKGESNAPPPESILDLYQLSFGAVCGVCTGVFVKKGLRAIAFLLGGVFVLLQVSFSLLDAVQEQ